MARDVRQLRDLFDKQKKQIPHNDSIKLAIQLDQRVLQQIFKKAKFVNDMMVEAFRNNVYEVAKNVLLNSFISGFGCAKVEIEDESPTGARVCIKSVFPDDILVDNTEYTHTDKVYTIVHRRVLPAKTVAATYP